MLINSMKIRNLIYGLLLIFSISGCTVHRQSQQPGESTIQHAYSGSYSPYHSYEKYPKYHPGDMFALDQEVALKTEFSGSLLGLLLSSPIDTYKIIVIKSFWNECDDKCKSVFSCKQFARLTPEGDKCYKKYEEIYKNCFTTCSDEIYEPTSLARHKTVGDYTDGSYYEHSMNDFSYFNNVHPEKDKHEKTKWQKDRDECMELTFEHETKKSNISKGFIFKHQSLVNQYAKYYRNCLKERGY